MTDATDSLKRAAAREAVRLVADGMTVGLGSGTVTRRTAPASKGGEGPRARNQTPARSAAADAAPSKTSSHLRPCDCVGVTVACRLAGWSSSRASPMSRSRDLVSRCRQCCNNWRTGAGVAAGSRDQSGSLFNTAARVSDTVSPSKARVPVSNS